MKRYLVFDSQCSLCTSLVKKVCNEMSGWVDGVLSLHDERAKTLLRQCKRNELSGPAIFEVSDNSVTLYVGFRFRWKLLTSLGVVRAWRVGRIVAGDLLAAQNAPANDLTEAGLGRRRLLSGLGRIAAAASIVAGIGYTKLGRAAKTPPVGPWYDHLAFQGDAIQVEGLELASMWQEFRLSLNLSTLISDPQFHALTDSPGISTMVALGAVPENIRGYKRMVEGGQVLNILVVWSGTTVLASHELKGGSERNTDSLRVSVTDDTHLRFHFVIMSGRFIFRRKRLDRMASRQVVLPRAQAGAGVIALLRGGEPEVGDPCDSHEDCGYPGSCLYCSCADFPLECLAEMCSICMGACLFTGPGVAVCAALCFIVCSPFLIICCELNEVCLRLEGDCG